jgi:hypothetical protein
VLGREDTRATVNEKGEVSAGTAKPVFVIANATVR